MKSDYALMDGHAHLDRIHDLPGALATARRNGVAGIVAVGMDLISNRSVLDLSREYPGYVHAALGYHPWSLVADEVPANLAFLREHAGDCVAFGEIGLDYKAKVKKNLQKDVFQSILHLARLHDKPVIVHSRLSHFRCFDMVKRAELAKAVFHWYSGPNDILQEILASGYYISATPALAYSPKHQEAVFAAPLEQILIETDCPVVYGNLKSSPADVVSTLHEVSRIKRLDIEVVARVTTENAVRLYGIGEGEGDGRKRR